jgi:uncharacterized protein YndB with AHSA1/START domain
MTNPTTITANPGDQVVDVERLVDAPIADVYRAYSDPELLAQWIGPRGYVTEVSKFDFRDGGEWAFSQSGDGDLRFAFHGSFHSVYPRESIVQTFEYEGAVGHVSLERVTFEEVGKSTRVRVHAVYQSIEDRDAMIASDMERGVVEGFERMDELLGSD